MNAFFDKKIFDPELAERVKAEFIDNMAYITDLEIKRYKKVSLKDESHWLWNAVDDMLKVNIGPEYSLLQRVTILRYDPGDFFDSHQDGPWNSRVSFNLPKHFYGGIEICEKSEFEGGEFFIDDKNIPFQKGRLFTHSWDSWHGIRKLTKGRRWSLDFLIFKEGNEHSLI
jgi:hypothetical protein